MNKAADYLRKIEWSMGNGQCPDCHGLGPLFSNWPDVYGPGGHKEGCTLASAIADADRLAPEPAGREVDVVAKAMVLARFANNPNGCHAWDELMSDAAHYADREAELENWRVLARAAISATPDSTAAGDVSPIDPAKWEFAEYPGGTDYAAGWNDCLRRLSHRAGDEIDPESPNFKEGMAVGMSCLHALERLIDDPVCSACGARSAKEAETMCRPSGDECPGTGWPLSKLWDDEAPSAPVAGSGG